MTTAGSRPDDPRAYVRLANLLREQIANGSLRPGQPTPSITTLTQEHGIARQTAAKALRVLEAEGLVYRVPGLGYYVAGTSGRRD
jgi:DNA-binding GntR family transcriptional regulator